jgi:hypothetical protein
MASATTCSHPLFTATGRPIPAISFLPIANNAITMMPTTPTTDRTFHAPPHHKRGRLFGVKVCLAKSETENVLSLCP